MVEVLSGAIHKDIKFHLSAHYAERGRLRRKKMTDASKRTAKDAASVAWAKSMIAYISGRITGDSQYKKKFANAETVLMNLGYTTLNPARLPEGLDYEQYMLLDFALIDASDVVVMLPDWRRSKGAMRERQYATETGKSVEYYETLIKIRMNELEDDAAKYADDNV